MLEKELVTTDAMSNFVEELKNKVYDWTDPSGSKLESWKEYASVISGKYKLVPASHEDILNILKVNGLLKDNVKVVEHDANGFCYSFDIANTEF